MQIILLKWIILGLVAISCVNALHFRPSRTIVHKSSRVNQNFLEVSASERNHMQAISFCKQAIFAISTIVALSYPLQAQAATEGAKTDKKFELCLSKCVFEETKPPPVGSTAERLETQRSRGEIIRDCRAKCATTKQQLLTGQPKPGISIKEDN